jgi:hypothetical protein
MTSMRASNGKKRQTARPVRRARRNTTATGDESDDDHIPRRDRSPSQPLEHQDLSTRVAELAATMPPLTEPQAAAAGRLTTRLDARIDHEQTS